MDLGRDGGSAVMNRPITLEIWPPVLDLIEPQRTIPVTNACSPPACMLALHAPKEAKSGWEGSDRAKLGNLIHKKIDEIANCHPSLINDLKANPHTVATLLSDSCELVGLDPRQLGDAWTFALRAFSRSLEIIESAAESTQQFKRLTESTSEPPQTTSDTYQSVYERLLSNAAVKRDG